MDAANRLIVDRTARDFPSHLYVHPNMIGKLRINDGNTSLLQKNYQDKSRETVCCMIVRGGENIGISVPVPFMRHFTFVDLLNDTHGFVGSDLAAVFNEANVELLNSIATSPKHFNTPLETVRRCAMWEKNVEYPMEDLDMFKKYGFSTAKGVLFCGPCGKTLVAMTTANECKLGFISVKGPEMLVPWFGESEASIRQIFDEARKSASYIMFFNEMDSIGFKSGSHLGDGGAVATILNQLLTEMEGIDAQKNVFVIGATNKPEVLDRALIRPGRIDCLIYIPLPDEGSRHQIFKACLRKSPLALEVDLLALAKCTQGYSGADIKEICNCAMKSAMLEEIERKKARDENIDWTDEEEEDGEDESVKINPSHFMESIRSTGRSVSVADLHKYQAFAHTSNLS